MWLIERFRCGLFNPSNIYKFKKESRWLTFLIFVILVLVNSVPGIIVSATQNTFTYQDEKELRETFYRDGNMIPFYIRHNQLVSSNDDASYIYEKVVGTFKIMMSTSTITVEGDSVVPTLIFAKNGVILNYSVYDEVLFSYSEYPILEGLDFSLAYEDNSDFWRNIFTVVRSELEEYKLYMVILSIVVVLMQSVMMIFIWSLIVAFFQKVNIGSQMKFSKVWQLMIYVTIPLVVGNLIADLFGFVLIYYIGFIMMVAYAARLGQAIVVGGGNNEL